MPDITVVIPQKIRKDLSNIAKADYPNEVFAFILGEVSGDDYRIQKLYFPEAKATPVSIHFKIGPELVEALEEAAEDNLKILGDVHSHPGFVEACPSEHDWINCKEFKDFYIKCPIMGILGVFPGKSGKLRTRLKFWPWIDKNICQIIL